MINSKALEANIKSEYKASQEYGYDGFRCTYGLAELMLEYIRQTRRRKAMRCFRIGYGCGCGDNEDYIIAHDQKEATDIAWEYARENYESYEGVHGIRDMYDIALEDYGISLDEVDEATYDIIEQDYIDEREGQLDYWAEEITEKEYLIGIGELDEEDE